jgi:tRNA(Arg) A34 adenosine deaminase TadA
MQFPELVVQAPDWIGSVIRDPMRSYPTVEERMRLVIALAQRNVEHGGGPFAAAVFDAGTQRIVAPGLNAVVPWHCSIAHAEMVALVLAQQRLATHDLGQAGLPVFELVTSTEPCAMCLGALPWSGIGRLVCGAREADARAVGFDEGDKPSDWIGALRRRGIVTTRDVLRDEASAVLRDYVRIGGTIYNGTVKGPPHLTPDSSTP